MPFDRILVAIDGSQGGQNALRKALEPAQATGASVNAFAVEGPLPAYAATIGEVDDVKREKDNYFGAVAASATEQADAAGVDFHIEVRAGHAAELITRYARDIDADLVVVGQKGTF